MMDNERSEGLLWQRLKFPVFLIITIWVIHLFQFITTIDLGIMLGIKPQLPSGLVGVLFAPLLHGDFGHLLSNTPPLFVLSALIFFFYRRIAVPSFLMIYVLTGLLVWIFARPQHYHIGASGVVYGLVAFVFWNGFFRRNVKSIALALIIAFYYGSMFIGIFPGTPGISWESHLLGAVVGIFTSFWFKGALERDERRPVYSWEREEAEQDQHYFLRRDAFSKTKRERREEQDKNRSSSGWSSTHT